MPSVLDQFTTAEFHAALKDAHGVTLRLTPFGEAECAAAPNLKVAARNGVGYDTVDVPALTKHRIPLMIAGIANSVSVAEHAIFLMIGLAKRGTDYDRMVREHRWADRFADLPVDLFQKTLLVIGFGRIGTRIAKRCLAMDMEVLVYDPYVPPAVVRGSGYEPVANLKDGLARRFVTVHCPKNSETIDLVGRDELAAMKRTAYIVNTARGGIINEDALYDARRPAPSRRPGSTCSTKCCWESAVQFRRRLAVEHVETGAADPAFGQGFVERRLVDDAAARRVDQICRRLHARQPRASAVRWSPRSSDNGS